MAAITAVQICRTWGFDSTLFVGDAQLVVEAVQQGARGWSRRHPLLEDLHHHLRELSHWKIAYSGREANRPAHELARMATKSVMDAMWVVDPPLCIQNLLLNQLPVCMLNLFVMISHRRKINCSILSASWLLSSILFLYIFFLFSCRVDYCYATDTLKKGEWITDDGNQTTLVSSGGTFELGFFTPINSSSHNRYFGIWYHKWDQQTVVWVANRADPILNGSTGTFGIAEDGNLKVLDTTGKQDYWSVDFGSSSTNRTVKLMDSGNLVFSDEDDQSATSLWESFQNPTDTVLPGMNISEFLSLTSWKSDGDPGFGQFMFNRNLEVIGGGVHFVATFTLSQKIVTQEWITGEVVGYEAAQIKCPMTYITCYQIGAIAGILVTKG
ncbi:uncharacterized protein LOC132181677 [Corylus avellana]|uniref:uncharacterized protein LOC132181677 n=1 Tax=Corylus avellana TaxID=13451 RepID=UPI00286BACB9|nr:uncharacterized protein LOC132181677 [Corylus avellana]